MEQIQFLRDKVSAALWQLREKPLMDVCRSLKCDGLDGREPGSVPRRLLIRKAEDVLDEIEISQTDEEVKEILNNVLIEMEKQEKGHETASEGGLAEKSSLPRHLPSAVKAGTEERCSPLRHPLLRSPEPPLKSTAYTLPEVTLRREFKVCGQIGESGQRDKLSYLSLIRQIEIGAEKGHTDTELTEAVIRAVSPGLPLRDMLEIKRGLTLSALLTILRGHYKVDSSTDLYHQLVSLSQEPKETALNFVFRAIELKEKLLWKADNEDTEEHYSRATIQRKFLRSIETGLLSDSIKFNILPHLSNVRITDEELIEKVNEASRVENERQEKRKKFTTAKGPKVQELSSDIQAGSAPLDGPVKYKEPNTTVTVKAVKGKENKVEQTMSTQQMMEELRTEMKQMLLTVMETNSHPPVVKQRLKGCQKCRGEGTGENCSHCFKCGQEGHFSRGCRAQRQLPGNRPGLQGRDHQ